MVECLGEDEYLIRVSCSKGTYVRTLCHDIGAALGCGGTMSSLRRTRVGTLREGMTLEQVQRAVQEGRGEELLTAVDSCFTQYPRVEATEREETKFIRNGTPYSCKISDGKYRVYSERGEFLMLGEARQGQMLTVKSFFEV